MLNLKKLLTKLCAKVGAIGTVYSAPWVATESSAYATPLTEYITLPPGTYILILTAPNISGSMAISGIGATGTFGTLVADGSTLTSIVQISSTGHYRALSAQSASVTFSYIERGFLRAIRIA